MKGVFAKFLAAALLLCPLAVPAQTVNGSFESNTSDPGAFWLTLSTGSTVIDGWTIDGSIDYIGGWWPAADGTKSLDMSGLTAGQVSQTIPTLPGATYAVSFFMSGNPDGEPWVKELTVTADGAQPEVFSYDVLLAGNSRSDMKWEQNQYLFVAEGESTLLTFTSGAFTVYGPTLDNIQVLTGVCHRNFGKKGQKTLMISPHALRAHLDHGDTPDPCAE